MIYFKYFVIWFFSHLLIYCILWSSELVKKRVEEYEKLQEESKRNEDCGRVTRTKTRAMANEEAKAKEEHADNKQIPDLVKVHNSQILFYSLCLE